MRDAFGGEFMIRLFLVFIVIYVAFAAISLNYAKAYRVKNKVISYIEENDITDLANLNCDGSLAKVITNNSYRKTCNDGNGPIYDDTQRVSAYCCAGVVIKANEKINNHYNYTVNTYADWNMGALNMILTFGGKQQNSESYVTGTWQISGEANVYARKTMNE